jgi:hypothetical protein
VCVGKDKNEKGAMVSITFLKAHFEQKCSLK